MKSIQMSSEQPKTEKGIEHKPVIGGSLSQNPGGAIITTGSNSTAVVSLSLSSSSSSSTNSSFYRGVNGSQQAIFNPILPSQNQNYYNGVYCSQQGFSSSSSVSSPNFNGYGYDSTWPHEGHFSMHSNPMSTENVRNLAAPLSEKSVLSFSNSSHSCCINKLGPNDGVVLSSSLTSSVYKSSVKEMEHHAKSGASAESQACVMNLTQNPPASMYKCTEQIPPSSYAQMNLYSLESSDYKYSSEIPLIGHSSNEDTSKNNRSQANIGKQTTAKFSHVPKPSNTENQACDLMPQQDLKQQDQCAYGSQGASYNSEHLDTYYLQGPFSFNVDNSQPHFSTQRHTGSHEESVYLTNKAFPSPSLDSQVGISSRSICHSDRPRSILDSSISSDLMRLDGYLHIDPKLMTSTYNQENYYSGKQNHHSLSGCDHELQQQYSINTSHILASQFSQPLSCAHSCSGIKTNTATVSEIRDECEILDSVNGKDIDVLESEDGSSQESLSIAEDDDIVVEEEIEEEKDKYSNLENCHEKVIQSELRDPLHNMRCLVCNTFQGHSLQSFILIPIKIDTPVTSVSCLPIITKLNHILLRKNKNVTCVDNIDDDDNSSKSFNGKYLCRHCLSLVERADDLEVKLGMIYQDLQCLYRKTNSLRKLSQDLEFNGEKCGKKDSTISSVSSKEVTSSEETCLTKSESIPIPNGSKVVNSDSDCGKSSAVQENSDNAELICGTKEFKLPHVDLNKSEDANVIEEEGKQVKSDLYQEVDEKLLNDQLGKEERKLNSTPSGCHDRSFICDLCDMKFSRKESLVKHMQIHTGVFSYRCEHCHKGFSRHGSLMRHIASRHNEGDRHLFQCEQCGKRYTQEHHLQVHLRSHRGELQHKCMQCGKAFASRNSLSIHLRTHTGERPYPCEACGKAFSTQSNLKAHSLLCTKSDSFREAKPKKAHKHVCSFCQKGFAKPSDLRVHLRSHTGEKPYVCERCGKRFCNSGNYNQHARSHCKTAPNLESLGLPVEEVSLSGGGVGGSEEGGSLKDKVLVSVSHPKVLSAVRVPYKCKVCGKEFSRKGAFIGHKNRHDGLKPHACEVCGKAFPDRSNLLKHKILHSELKPHKCGVCGKSFRSSLKVHMRVHTGEKPFSCSICSQRFTVKSSLVAHVKKHQKGNDVVPSS